MVVKSDFSLVFCLDKVQASDTLFPAYDGHAEGSTLRNSGGVVGHQC